MLPQSDGGVIGPVERNSWLVLKDPNRMRPRGSSIAIEAMTRERYFTVLVAVLVTVRIT